MIAFVACPFCQEEMAIPSQEGATHFIVCGGCGARGPRKPTQAEAVDAYNTRLGSGKAEPRPSFTGKES